MNDKQRRAVSAQTTAAEHLSADDLAGVVEALTGQRVIPRPSPADRGVGDRQPKS
ncbi:hypothetical protein ACWEK5_43305 [Rhodococcus koreensis]